MHSILAAIALAATTLSFASEPRVLPRAAAPATFGPAVARGDAAMDALRDRLSARLGEALRAGGPAQALQVCRSEAPAIARQIGEQHGVRVGRTALRLRNPGNAAPAWARSWIAAASGKKAAEAGAAVVDLGDRIGMLRPIALAPACTRCHGALDGIDPAVRAELARSYPADQATGFAPGELRGFMWAEVPKR